jgi:glyoxylase-like metal-dependent hydrolase (beta-lactamase superfamily II)
MEIKGHTPGHSAYLIGSGTDTLLYTGDTMHHSIVSVQQPDWTIAFDSDPKAAVVTRKKLFDRIAADRLRVLGYHMPWPGLGHIAKRGAGYEWMIEPWSWE